MADGGGLSFDEHGYVDMDQVPEVDLDTAELADLRASLAGVPPEVLDAHGWDELVQTATAEDAPMIDDDLVPDDDTAPGPLWDSPVETPAVSEWQSMAEQQEAAGADAGDAGDSPVDPGGADDHPHGWDAGHDHSPGFDGDEGDEGDDLDLDLD